MPNGFTSVAGRLYLVNFAAGALSGSLSSDPSVTSGHGTWSKGGATNLESDKFYHGMFWTIAESAVTDAVTFEFGTDWNGNAYVWEATPANPGRPVEVLEAGTATDEALSGDSITASITDIAASSTPFGSVLAVGNSSGDWTPEANFTESNLTKMTFSSIDVTFCERTLEGDPPGVQDTTMTATYSVSNLRRSAILLEIVENLGGWVVGGVTI